MAMTPYQPFPMTNPNNPYTSDFFRQNAKNKFAQLQQTLVSASVPSSAGSVPVSGDYSNYGAGYESFQKNLNTALAKSGFDPAWATPLTEIVKKESSFNPKAKNPKSTAHGYAQFLNSTRANYEKKLGISYDDPVNQLIMMMHYVKDRYKTPENALSFWQKNKWY
jgi:soluble lytic murein transglycosylase-like protein